MKSTWIDNNSAIVIKIPAEFSFTQCLKFLSRSPREPCHTVIGNKLYKLVKFQDVPVLLRIECLDQNTLRIAFLPSRLKKSIRAMIANYVWDWFDLQTDLKPFYRMARKDSILKQVAAAYFGLRILIIHDLFEAICWGIIGQHINLQFAYTLKNRFVASFGEKFSFDKESYYLFPSAKTIARLSVAELRDLQFTEKKSQYIIESAAVITNGDLTKKSLLNQKNFAGARKTLMELRGVGKWTAEYVTLRCLRDPAALPADDVGLQNALKYQLGLNHKPTADEIIQVSKGWKNWQAYATFYLWHSLI
jgi:DNA-3-methyladenine glycosylase II